MPVDFTCLLFFNPLVSSSLFPAATVATSPSSDSVCDFDHGLCGWTHDPTAPLFWSLYSHGKSFSLLPWKILHESALLSGRLTHSELLLEAGGLSLMNSHLQALFLVWIHLQNSCTRLFRFYFGIRYWDLMGSSDRA